MIERLKELLRHSAIYGLGSIVARVLGVLLLPLYTRYLSPSDYGLIETLVALSAVLTALVAQGMKSAFFRFYFDSAEPARRHLVVRTAFWYVMAASTVATALGIVLASQISWLLFGTHGHGGLVIAAFVGLWAALNYEQMTSLFRVEQRSTAYVAATLANAHAVGRYSIGVRVASAIVLLLTAFRMAWPAFAYSIEDDREAQRTYSFVLTYVVFVCCWLALALGLLAPWIVKLITTEPFYPAQNVVAPLAFGVAAFGAYVVVQIGTGRARQTRSNWLVTGAAAAVNVALNLALIPSYGRMGAAIATVVAYTLLFVGMAWRAQRVFPVSYQWRRVATLGLAAVGLTVLGKLLDAPLAVALALTAAFPLVLLVLGFYLPAERRRLRRLLPILGR